jgi:glycosyltransferase involved in cell wall biosynthesis
MATIGFVTTCMGRLADLKQTLGGLANQSGCSCVVVDYSCPDRAGDWAEANYPQVRVVRVPGRSEFNLAAARNAGARAVDAPWLCFVDADIRLGPEFGSTVLAALVRGGYYRVQAASGGLGGTVVCHRDDFERLGGYDEMYRCWGEEDNDLYDGLKYIGVEARTLPLVSLQHLEHGDNERTRFYPVADLTLGHAINRVYRIVKWDTARLRFELLSWEGRQAMYEKVVEVVTGSVRSGTPGDLTVHLPVGLVPGGRTLVRDLTYRLIP